MILKELELKVNQFANYVVQQARSNLTKGGKKEVIMLPVVYINLSNQAL